MAAPERTPLTVAAITSAAIELIDRDGLDGLSMRRLGTTLGYEAMALYKHVADKSALLDAVVEEVYAEMQPPDPAEPWQERIRSSARELRRVAQRHPHLFVRLVTEPPSTTAVVERIDSILSALQESGGDDAEVVHRFFLFVNMTSGVLLAETTALIADGGTAVFDTERIDAEARCRALLHFGERLATCDFDAEFDRTIEAYLSLVDRDQPGSDPG
ncbi:TetR/AcrR family transcriptional regulator [Ilumatobacter nonamiensis]|uniref:TetR/AcrR family transcriptional regulator n=1 Tax=Ilumatobacter nonamiensis TaxID=467093 RepID=UPI0006845AA9|nr:TetR family transcriptional regulator [Ilumatobacter nonamiensis]